MKALYYISSIIILCASVSPISAQNFNYLNSGDEFEIDISSDLNTERDIISNLIILMDYDIYNRNYQAMLRGLERLTSIYSPDSLSVLLRELELFESHHPFLRLCENKTSEKSGYASWQPFQSQQFTQYFEQQVKLFKKHERLLKGTRLISSKIYKNSKYYLTNHAYAEAKYLLNWLKKDYPSTYYIKRGFVDNRLRNIELEVGKKLPVNSFTTIDGQKLNIDGSSDNPTLIAYLDIFSTDYKSELSNTIKVGELVQNIQLVVLLNSNILREELSTLIPSNGLNPDWVIAGKDLKEKLGLSDYSLNLLVSAENKILAKDMNFSNLPEEVAFLYNSSGILARK